MGKPIVLIYVNGGVADWEAEGDVEVHLLDSDNIKAGDPPVRLSGRALAVAREVDPSSEGEMYISDSVPYPDHCLQRDICAGKSNCQRDPNCID